MATNIAEELTKLKALLDSGALTQEEFNTRKTQLLNSQETFASYQGQPQYGPVGAVGSKSKLAAGLLGIFLGAFGVHNFYLGHTGKAIAQLLLTVIGWIIIIGPAAAGIWGLIEGILILSSHAGSSWHKDAQGYELQD